MKTDRRRTNRSPWDWVTLFVVALLVALTSVFISRQARDPASAGEAIQAQVGPTGP